MVRRSPQGERGLKFITGRYLFFGEDSRSPQGERGLKWLPGPPEYCGLMVALRKESVD